MNTENPKTLKEAIVAFSKSETAFNTMVQIRWGKNELLALVACQKIIAF